MIDHAHRVRAGARAGVPFALAGFVLAISFAAFATEAAGLSATAAVVMSALTFAGAAQLAAVGIIAAGGGVGAAVAAAAMMQSRFLPMGFALAPSLKGGRLRRVFEGQATVDSSWAMAARGDGTYDREYLFGHAGVQYLAWVSGTVVGALGPELNTRDLGLDAVFPAFFLAILMGELRDRRRIGVAVAGGLLAFSLVPVVPAGVPILLASAVALIGLRTRP